MSTIKIENLYHSYGSGDVLKNINLTINDGEFLTLLGPSGCGKTTLLRILAGFISPTSGKIMIDDQDITRLRSEKRNMGVVFQNYALFPNMNVEDNIAYGLKIRKTPRDVIRQRLRYYIEVTGLMGLEKRRIYELSGGQQQRVAIARALAIEPYILLLDEPMSNLDAMLRIRMREELKQIQKKTGVTTLFITHDQQEALTISDRIAVINEGKIIRVDTPHAIYDDANDESVAKFIGTSNVIEYGDGSRRFVRPEKMQLSTDPAMGDKAIITDIKFHGIYYEYVLKMIGGDGRLKGEKGNLITVIKINDAECIKNWKNGDIAYVSAK